jgi:hypothetical protein
MGAFGVTNMGVKSGRDMPTDGTDSLEQRCAECGELFPTAQAVAEHEAVTHHRVLGVKEP